MISICAHTDIIPSVKSKSSFTTCSFSFTGESQKSSWVSMSLTLAETLWFRLSGSMFVGYDTCQQSWRFIGLFMGRNGVT